MDAPNPLGIPGDESLVEVFGGAWLAHQSRAGRKDAPVSHLELFYGTVVGSGVVRDILWEHGFDRRRFEKELGVRVARMRGESNTHYEIEDAHELREWYRSNLADRSLDAVGMAAMFVANLKIGAGLRRDAALKALMYAIGTRENDLIPFHETLRESLVGSALDAFNEAAVIAFVDGPKRHVLTSDALGLGIVSSRRAGDSGPEFLHEWIRRQRPDFLETIGADVMSEPAEWISRGAMYTLREATDIAQRVAGTSSISGRHLVGAMIATRHLHSGMRTLLTKELGLDLEQLARDFLNYLDKLAPRDAEPDDLSAWRELLYLDEDPTRVPRYHAEGYTKKDYLGTSADARAFAKLIASTDLKPPLSIALFGDWGSGKSFFMGQVRDEIETLAAMENENFHQRIAHITFNAWHYVESNLWASLVANIFQNLRTSRADDDPAKRTTEVLAKLGEAITKKADAEKKVEEAKLARDEAAGKLEQKRAELQKTSSAISVAAARDVWDFITVDNLDPEERKKLQDALKEVGIDRAIDTVDDLRASVAEVRGIAQESRTVWSTMAAKPTTWWWLIAVALLVPAVALVVGALLTDLRPQLAQLGAIVSAVSTWIAGISAWLTSRAGEARKVLARINEARASVDRLFSKAEERKQAALKAEQSVLEQKTTELTEAQTDLENANADVVTQQQALLALRAGERLARFIDDRATSDDYRKLLGVLATVRNDFEMLTALMGQQATEAPLPAGVTPLEEQYRLDRIVLYIDDLDRCPADRVVEVLQAVHLLLAFPLFVVVVGVDAQWLRESLRLKHANLWVSATPDDYLEKIFQVPFWLSAMTPSTTRRFVLKLLANDLEPDVSGDGHAGGSTGGSSGGGYTATGGGEPVKHEPAMVAEPDELDVAELKLRACERDFMTEIADLFGRSPRSAKRYVNTYRIIRARVALRRVDAFLDETSALPEYRGVLVLLAVIVGLPKVAGELFTLMKKTPAETTLEDFARGLPWKRLSAVLTGLAQKHPRATVGDLAAHRGTVRRYSFVQ
ncbi:MAG TPA: P-loop NTPase fold protein [Thermoanaerobaculia bacterium]